MRLVSNRFGYFDRGSRRRFVRTTAKRMDHMIHGANEWVLWRRTDLSPYSIFVGYHEHVTSSAFRLQGKLSGGSRHGQWRDKDQGCPPSARKSGGITQGRLALCFLEK